MFLVLAIAALVGSAVPSSDVSVRDIQATGPEGPLKGSYTSVPDVKAPILLMIPGSGPTDRDGNNVLGVKAAPLRLLAEGLAARGIASVRVDKRGMFASGAAARDPNAVTIQNYADDLNAWIRAIRTQAKAPCVWLLGHSEGGLVALVAAAQRSDYICGVILVSTAGRPVGDLLKAQLRGSGLDEQLLTVADQAIDQLAAGRPVDSDQFPPQLAPIFKKDVQGFLISLFQLDPVSLIARTKMPILIMQGDRDLQVSVHDAERLREAAVGGHLKLLPNTNHVLKQVASEDPRDNLATYADPHLPLAPGVVDAIDRFVREKRNN